ncbi:S1 family peptidase [Nocardia huaxiensis]|uniref:S1 family peptidase n=1 Tax=Nocardia huaxiensis TaxID=2755382 RepID=UPI001E2B762C|nr:S1 family peptidase [Nocardia huaxiensis]UFS99367.1 S1 family peptidase [Nocardia huaxiensis]
MVGRFLMLIAAIGMAWTSAGSARAADPAVLGGGSGIVLDDGALCTLTTIGWDARGRMVGFTAAHCGTPGAGIASEADREAGTLGAISFTNPELDYAVIEFDEHLVTPVNRIGATTISGYGLPAQFPAIACKQGRTTGHTCGLVYGDLFATQTWTFTQICVIVGDSGGPVVVGTTLVGMVNGYLSTPCLGPEVGVNFSTVVGDVDARGGVGAGFRPV